MAKSAVLGCSKVTIAKPLLGKISTRCTGPNFDSADVNEVAVVFHEMPPTKTFGFAGVGADRGASEGDEEDFKLDTFVASVDTEGLEPLRLEGGKKTSTIDLNTTEGI